MPHREPSYTLFCQLVNGDKKQSERLCKLRELCELSIKEAAEVYGLPIMRYMKVERGELGFEDWYRSMELMCVKANKPFDLIQKVRVE